MDKPTAYTREEVLSILEDQKTGHEIGEREICVECIDRIKAKF